MKQSETTGYAVGAVKAPEISLVIPCRDNLPFLKKCLDSLEKQLFRSFEVVVVDNGSSDGLEREILSPRSFPVLILHEKENRGFAGAVNRGIRSCRAKIVVVLNADLTFDPDFLRVIRGHFRRKEACFAACRVMSADGRRIESLGIRLTPMLRARNARNAAEALGPAGAAFAFRMPLPESLSLEGERLLDERYFFLWEDVELAVRLSRAGIPCHFLDRAVCFHHGNATRSGYFYRQYLSFRNRFYLIKTYFPGYWKRRLPAVLFYDLPRSLFVALCNPYRFKLARDVTRLWLERGAAPTIKKGGTP